MHFNFTRKKWVIIAVIVVALSAGSFYAYRKTKNKSPQVIKSVSQDSATSQPEAAQSQVVDPATGEAVNSGDNSTADNTSASDDSSSSSAADNSSSTEANGTDNSSSNGLDINKNSADGGKMLAHITTQHCDDDCKAFGNDLSLLEYCQQVCGITPVKKVSNCDGKKGIEKDYCLKDLGITKDDASICDQISDANVKDTCKNRIAEDIIEQQSPSSGE